MNWGECTLEMWGCVSLVQTIFIRKWLENWGRYVINCIYRFESIETSVLLIWDILEESCLLSIPEVIAHILVDPSHLYMLINQAHPFNYLNICIALFRRTLASSTTLARHQRKITVAGITKCRHYIICIEKQSKRWPCAFDDACNALKSLTEKNPIKWPPLGINLSVSCRTLPVPPTNIACKHSIFRYSNCAAMPVLLFFWLP